MDDYVSVDGISRGSRRSGPLYDPQGRLYERNPPPES